MEFYGQIFFTVVSSWSIQSWWVNHGCQITWCTVHCSEISCNMLRYWAWYLQLDAQQLFKSAFIRFWVFNNINVHIKNPWVGSLWFDFDVSILVAPYYARLKQQEMNTNWQQWSHLAILFWSNNKNYLSSLSA